MADLEEVRDAIAALVDTIPGLQGVPRMPGQITPPTAIPMLESVDFDSAMDRGSDDYTWVLMVFTSHSSETGQDLLMQYASGSGTKSVKAVFEADPTLGGLVFDANVTEVRPPGDYEMGAITYYAIPFVIQVSAAGL
jgi:hypothetical protein